MYLIFRRNYQLVARKISLNHGKDLQMIQDFANNSEPVIIARELEDLTEFDHVEISIDNLIEE